MEEKNPIQSAQRIFQVMELLAEKGGRGGEEQERKCRWKSGYLS